MSMAEFDEEFVEELEKRIEIIKKSDTSDKRLSSIDYFLVWIFCILSFVILIFGRIL